MGIFCRFERGNQVEFNRLCSFYHKRDSALWLRGILKVDIAPLAI